MIVAASATSCARGGPFGIDERHLARYSRRDVAVKADEDGGLNLRYLTSLGRERLA